MGMATPVKMPELGESITEGTITRWLKQEGDRVEVDEPLYEISTDKVDTEVPSPVAGVLQSIKEQVDETVEVGTELAVIEQDGEAAAEAEPEAAEEPEEKQQPAAEEPEEAPAAEERPAAAAAGDGMATPVKMPELGESITEGTITRWLKQEGDRVEVDEPLYEISTDKVDTEVPSPVAGVLKSIKVQVDETVEVGTELAVIEQDGEAAAEAEPEAAEEPEEKQQPAAEEPEEAPAAEERPAAAAAGDGEATVVKMPELGESITEGTITRWLKQEGDRVEVDEPLYEISTDKVDTEVPSPVAGVL